MKGEEDPVVSYGDCATAGEAVDRLLERIARNNDAQSWALARTEKNSIQQRRVRAYNAGVLLFIAAVALFLGYVLG